MYLCLENSPDKLVTVKKARGRRQVPTDDESDSGSVILNLPQNKEGQKKG